MTGAVVITPPAPILTPADISGSHEPDDAGIAGLIAAATEEIDGPTGWLGRALGPQTLEYQLDRFYAGGRAEIALPCPPLIEIVSVKYDDGAGVEQTVAPAAYGIFAGRAVYPKLGFPWPSAGRPRIRYRAGYDGTTTGPVPERARQAIILAVNELRSVGIENLFLRSVDVPGVSSRTYTVSDQAGEVIRKTTERLLSGLRVYSP